MTYRKCIFLIFGLPLLSQAVKVNMQGSLSLGKDVVETISYYLKESYNIDGRRALKLDDMTSDTISIIVNSAFLCRDIDFCHGKSKFVNNYIIMLTKTIENLFEQLLQANTREQLVNEIPKGVIFEEELKIVLRNVTKFLSNANRRIREESEIIVWTELVKKINAKFQERAIIFASERLEGSVKEVGDVKQKLIQKLIIDTTVVELDFINKLCFEEEICIESYEVSKALKLLLEELQVMPDIKTKAFIRYFYETLPDVKFYNCVTDATANEFQAILNDMAYAENIHTKNVLAAVQKTVTARLDSIKYKSNDIAGGDIKLLHVILSDMDHFYSTRHGIDPFHKFFKNLYDWVKVDDRFSVPIRQVMKDIANMLSLESDELVTKLVNEVRVFLEITVDPEK